MNSTLPFPNRPIVPLPVDPLAHAVRDIESAAHDFTFALAEAFNAKDREGLAEIVDQLGVCVEALLVAVSMGRDFTRRMKE